MMLNPVHADRRNHAGGQRTGTGCEKGAETGYSAVERLRLLKGDST